jgi:hypothetical protein
LDAKNAAFRLTDLDARPVPIPNFGELCRFLVEICRKSGRKTIKSLARDANI